MTETMAYLHASVVQISASLGQIVQVVVRRQLITLLPQMILLRFLTNQTTHP